MHRCTLMGSQVKKLWARQLPTQTSARPSHSGPGVRMASADGEELRQSTTSLSLVLCEDAGGDSFSSVHQPQISSAEVVSGLSLLVSSWSWVTQRTCNTWNKWNYFRTTFLNDVVVNYRETTDWRTWKYHNLVYECSSAITLRSSGPSLKLLFTASVSEIKGILRFLWSGVVWGTYE